jgi:hypothetical protein
MFLTQCFHKIPSDAPPNFLRNSNVGTRANNGKKKSWGTFLVRSILGVRGHVGTPEWD